jgi:hypothetical protein
MPTRFVRLNVPGAMGTLFTSAPFMYTCSVAGAVVAPVKPSEGTRTMYGSRSNVRVAPSPPMYVVPPVTPVVTSASPSEKRRSFSRISYVYVVRPRAVGACVESVAVPYSLCP